MTNQTEYFSCVGEPYLILLPDMVSKYNVTVEPEDATCGTNGRTTWCNVYAVSQVSDFQYWLKFREKGDHNLVGWLHIKTKTAGTEMLTHAIMHSEILPPVK